MIEDQGVMMDNMSNDIKEIKEVQIIRLIKEIKFLGDELTKKENVERVAVLLICFLVVVSSFIQYKEHIQTMKSLEDLKELSQKIEDELESLKKYQENRQSNYRPLKEESPEENMNIKEGCLNEKSQVNERNEEQVKLNYLKKDFQRFKNVKRIQKEDWQIKMELSNKNTNENTFGFYGFFKCILVLIIFFALLVSYTNVTKDNANENTIKFHTLLKCCLELITFLVILVLYWEVSKKNANESTFGLYGFLKFIITLITLLVLLVFYKIYNESKREVLFRVDRLNERKNSEEKIFSPYFYSHFNGYKLRLQVYPGGCNNFKDTHLSLFFVICKGEYDNELQWPYKHSITLSVINQNTQKEYNYMTFSHSTVKVEHTYCFNKPINEDNVGYGGPSFISHEDIQRVSVNNVVVIKCIISPPQ